jgi:PPOX class probable F420-dependent enzyme
VVVTLKGDGRPQLSNVMYAVGDDDVIRVSVTVTRAKTANVRRDPRVSFHVTSADFWSYVVAEGDAELSAVAAAPDDATVDELVEVYRAISGEHPDWDDYRADMVRQGRLVLRLRPTHVYGSLPGA